MILSRIALALSALLCFQAVSSAQTPGKPYPPVAAHWDRAAESDADLATLIKVLRAAVAGRDAGSFEATLSPGFVALDCSTSPLKPCGPGKARAIGGKPAKGVGAIERMRLAFCCDGKPAPDMPEAAQNDTMFAILGASLGVDSLGANPDAKGEICAPALPIFDRAKAAKAAKAAGVEPENMRVASVDMPLLERPAKGAAPLGQLSAGDLAPVVTDLTADTPPGWTAIGLPDGRIGYTDALGLDELTPAAICFGKEKGQWRILSTIQRNS